MVILDHIQTRVMSYIISKLVYLKLYLKLLAIFSIQIVFWRPVYKE